MDNKTKIKKWSPDAQGETSNQSHDRCRLEGRSALIIALREHDAGQIY